MPKFVEMDETVTLIQQLAETGSPVILINRFNVKPEDVEQLLSAWAADAAWMKQQPGYISTQLHRGIGGSCVFLNYAVWESVGDFKRAFGHPEFQAKLQHYPAEAIVSPHLFQKVAAPRVCVDQEKQ
ncbi:MAG: antibiotic biosynthesis monooxygenase family protein [Blastocatellia bacterium]